MNAVMFAGVTMLTAVAYAANYGNSIPANTVLNAGDSLVSQNGAYILAMQSDGNLVIYSIASNGSETAKWATGAAGGGAYTAMQGDGNLVLYSANGTAAWNSRTGGHAAAAYKLVLQDSGELDIFPPNSTTPLWSANVPICGPNTATM